MIDGGNFVEILGERFPAVNIQIPECYPWPYESDIESPGRANIWFGAYFEMMFETGFNITVFQEMAEVLNGSWSTNCSDLLADDFRWHFIVEITHRDDKTMTFVIFAHHCENEEKLVEVLKHEMKMLAEPATFMSALSA